MDAIENLIKCELSKAIAMLGGASDILSTVNSWGKEISNADVLNMLKAWNTASILKKEEELKHLKQFYR